MLIDAEKAFNKVQHPFLIKTTNSSKVGTEGNFLSWVTGIYQTSEQKLQLTWVTGQRQCIPPVQGTGPERRSHYSGQHGAEGAGSPVPSELTMYRCPTNTLSQVGGLDS